MKRGLLSRIKFPLLGLVILSVVVQAYFQAAAAAKPADEWEQAVAAAKREGKVSVIGPQGVDTRLALTEGFHKRYPEIQVEYSGIHPTQITPKVATELRAGRNSTDLAILGTTTALEGLMPANAIAPIPPFLVGPSTRDLAKWRGGRLEFSDDAGQYNLVFSFYRKSPFVYNTTLVSGGEFKSYKDLLDPKWRGKIGIRNPTRAGGGHSNAVFWYTHSELGKDFIRQLFSQEITSLDDDRQFLDFVAKGKLLIGIGSGDTYTVEMIRKGLPIKYVDPTVLREGVYLTSGTGTLVVIQATPHPNATKIYLDYLLSQEGQLAWSRAVSQVSTRRDVPVDHLLKEFVPEEGVKYQANYKEHYVKLSPEIVAFLKTVMAR